MPYTRNNQPPRCYYCDRVRPRTMTPFGLAHRRCIPIAVLEMMRRQQAEKLEEGKP